MASVDRPAHSGPTFTQPQSPGHAYAALCGLSTVPRPTVAQRRRIRELARYLLDVGGR